MKGSNAQSRTIQVCALRGWPLSTVAPSWGQPHLYQELMRKYKPAQIQASTPSAAEENLHRSPLESVSGVWQCLALCAGCSYSESQDIAKDFM